MKETTLVAESGRPTGTRASRRLRREGRIPGVIYGSGSDSLPISVDWKELRAILAAEGTNALVSMQLDGASRLALVYGVHRHPVRRSVEHVDFLEVDPDKPIHVEVPLRLVGEAEGVSRAGGVVEQQLNSLPISAPPVAIPQELELDISSIDFDAPLTVGDIVRPERVEILLEPDLVMAVANKTRAALALERAARGETVTGVDADLVEALGGDASGDDDDED